MTSSQRRHRILLAGEKIIKHTTKCHHFPSFRVSTKCYRERIPIYHEDNQSEIFKPSLQNAPSTNITHINYQFTLQRGEITRGCNACLLQPISLGLFTILDHFATLHSKKSRKRRAFDPQPYYNKWVAFKSISKHKISHILFKNR